MSIEKAAAVSNLLEAMRQHLRKPATCAASVLVANLIGGKKPWAGRDYMTDKVNRIHPYRVTVDDLLRGYAISDFPSYGDIVDSNGIMGLGKGTISCVFQVISENYDRLEKLVMEEFPSKLVALRDIRGRIEDHQPIATVKIEEIIERFKRGRPFITLSDANKCIEWLRENIQAILETFPEKDRHRVCEGGGFEDIVASLTITVMSAQKKEVHER